MVSLVTKQFRQNSHTKVEGSSCRQIHSGVIVKMFNSSLLEVNRAKLMNVSVIVVVMVVVVLISPCQTDIVYPG